ncbi:DUF4129 domain-containing protein [Niabella sp. W65]|nr:DUF4129 domain-containing protein [Niabella sp. W65]MCH7361479.1 DUF4129 domain-containing protein [Niabella sp. W65]ULT45275.1 DUF4129 domain-containing protein [Niabella sp. I65]
MLKDIFSIEYAAAIKEALNNKNYRLAIRLHYLQLLKMLSEKGVIHYQPDKTNFDYLLQVRSTPHYSDFSGLTRQYEYSWYGLFPISQSQYEQIDLLFTNFQKRSAAGEEVITIYNRIGGAGDSYFPVCSQWQPEKECKHFCIAQ